MKGGLTSNQLKWIALASMTADHFMELFKNLISTNLFIKIVELFGRIAAPLFLFVLTESLHYVKNRANYVMRLYFAGISVALFTIVTNLLLGNILIYEPGNIMFSYFYIGGCICLIEKFIRVIKEKNLEKTIVAIIYCIVLAGLQILIWKADTIIGFISDLEIRKLTLKVINALFPSVFTIEYSIIFVIMGALIYFSPNKIMKCGIVTIFSMLAYWGANEHINFWPCNDFFFEEQYLMIFAIPFIFMYNKKEGKKCKMFFYIYYPIHRYILALISELI